MRQESNGARNPRLSRKTVAQTVRREENLLATKDGSVIFTKHPFIEEALA